MLSSVNLVHNRPFHGNTRVYTLRKYQRSNQSTCIDQRPAVVKGQVVKRNEIIADSSESAGIPAGWLQLIETRYGRLIR